MDDHDLIAPITGKWIKSDGTVVDAAEMIEALYKALVVNKNAGVEVDGMGHVDTVAVTDPDAETANQLSLLRGLLKQLQTKVVTELSGSNALSAVAVTPDDNADLVGGATKGLYLGAAGNVKVDMADGTTVAFIALANGMVHPISVKRVYDTDTTATAILAVY